MSTDKRVVTKTQAVRAELKARGWCQGVLVDAATGRVCVLGAVRVALDHKPEGHGRYTHELDMFVIGRTGSSVTVFNDAPGRTVEEIYDLLDDFEKAQEAGKCLTE
jgi:hypothetical protein